MNERAIGIFTIDLNFCVQTWDAWLATITGISFEQASGRKLIELVPDLEQRGLLPRFQRVMQAGVVEVLSPTFHHYLLPCAPLSPSGNFDKMQQHITIAPLRVDGKIIGAIVTLEDVTARIEEERGLAAQLATGKEGERMQAARQLAASETLAGTGPLLGALADESWRVRKVAVGGLVSKGGQDAVATLLLTMRDEHQNLSVLNSALQVLAMTGLDIVSPIIDFIGSDDTHLRIYAVQLLGELDDPGAVQPLLAALHDKDLNVRYHAIEALGKLHATEAVEPLLEIAESREFFLAFPAIDALIAIADSSAVLRLAPLLEDDIFCEPVAEALGKLGDEDIIAPLLAILNRQEAPTVIIVKALAALHKRYEKQFGEGAHIADQVCSFLLPNGEQNILASLQKAGAGELTDLVLVMGWLKGGSVERALTRLLGNPSARREVIDALVMKGERVTDLLIEQLESDEADIRKAALIALGRICDPASVTALIRMLDDDDDLVIIAAGVLAKIGDRRAFEPLIGLLGHPSMAVRQAIISALNSIGHPDMARRMSHLLDDSDSFVREAAVKIAAYFGYTECIDQLFAKCEDEEEIVRHAAVQNIPFLEDDRILPLLVLKLQNDTPKIRSAAAYALGLVDDPMVLQLLIGALADSDPWVRYFAARAIGRRGSPEALEALSRLARVDTAPHVRIAAIEALGQTNDYRAIAELAQFTEDENADLGRAAIDSLGIITHPDALRHLLSLIRAKDPIQRRDVVLALGKRRDIAAIDALTWIAGADEEEEIALAAIEALAALAVPEAISALIELTADKKRREACIVVLSRLEEAHLELIARGLSNPQPEVRRAMVNTLTRMKLPAASALVKRALTDPEPGVRLAAVTALGQLGNRSADRQLAMLAHGDSDEAVCRAARRTLQKRTLQP